MTDIMTHQDTIIHTNSRTRLFYYCLFLSLLVHIIVVLTFYVYKPDEIRHPAEQSTKVKLVDLPMPKELAQARNNEPRDYEVDELPAVDQKQPAVESQRKADRNQKVTQETAPKGEDARDETTLPLQPVIPLSSAPIEITPQIIPQGKQQKKTTTSEPQTTHQEIEKKRSATDTQEHLRPEQPAAVMPKPEPEKAQQDPEPQAAQAQPSLTPSQLFPDARTLSRIAQGKLGSQNRVKQRDDVAVGDTVWLNLQNDLLVSFFRRFRDRIERVWNYPKDAAQQGLEGTLELLIIVDKNGELIDVLPNQSSGSDILDLAAIQAVYAGAPFGPLSEHYPHEQLKIRAYFSYRISGRYIYGR